MTQRQRASPRYARPGVATVKCATSSNLGCGARDVSIGHKMGSLFGITAAMAIAGTGRHNGVSPPYWQGFRNDENRHLSAPCGCLGPRRLPQSEGFAAFGRFPRSRQRFLALYKACRYAACAVSTNAIYLLK